MKFTKLLLLAGAALLLGCTSIPPTQAAVNLLDFIPDAEEVQLLDPACPLVADSYMAQAIDQGPGTIYLPRGCLKFNQTLHVKRQVRLIGEGEGIIGEAGTELRFAPNIDGIIFHNADTDASGIVTPGYTAAGAVLEGVKINGQGGLTAGRGIWMRTSIKLHDVNVTGFGDNCIHIRATAGSGDPTLRGSANQWMISGRSRATFCRNGLFIEGNDVNAGISIMFDASQNREWGIADKSFLGNVHLMPHTAANTLGSYLTSNPNGRNLFLNPYAEGNQPAASLTKSTMSVHGLNNIPITIPNRSPARPRIMTDVRDSGFSYATKDNADNRIHSLHLTGEHSMLAIHAQGDHAQGWSLGASWDKFTRTWVYRHAINTARTVIALTTDLSPTSAAPYKDEAGNPIPAGEIVFPKGVWVPSATVPGRYMLAYPVTP